MADPGPSPVDERWFEEEPARKLTEIVPVGLIRTDTTGRCLYVNQRWCQLTGLRREEVLGKGWVRALHPDDRLRVFRQWQKPPGEVREFADEFRFQTPDGRTRVVSTRILPLYDAANALTGYLGAFTDITERQQTEEALRKLAHELRERIKELNCLFGISHVVEQARGSLPEILQRTVDLLPPSWEYPETTCARIVMEGSEYRTRNFVDSPVATQASEIRVGDQVIGRVEVGYLQERPPRDEGPFLADERKLLEEVAKRLGRIAERLRTEQRLREREEELRQRLTHLTRVSLMGEMASSIAHEISQPLTAIATYAQASRRLLTSDAADMDRVSDILARISDESLRAGQILHRLRDLVRVHADKRVEWDVNQLVREVEQVASMDARLHNVRIGYDLTGTLPPVAADGVQIQQVILNLIRNAIDAMADTAPDAREVVVRTATCDHREVEVSVSDHGAGVPPELDDKLFEPFFTTKTEGIGMGLSISRSIVAEHGGRMWFSRNSDAGTTFFFTLPTVESSRDGEG